MLTTLGIVLLAVSAVAAPWFIPRYRTGQKKMFRAMCLCAIAAAVLGGICLWAGSS